MRNYVAYEHGDCRALEALVAHYGYLAFEKAFRLFHRLGDEARDLAQELLCDAQGPHGRIAGRSFLPSEDNPCPWEVLFLLAQQAGVEQERLGLTNPHLPHRGVAGVE